MRVKLQNIIFPSTQNCTEELLFFRRFEDVKYSLADDSILLDRDGLVEFNTYFNGFSASKWFKYTNIKQVGVHLVLEGKVRIALVYKEKQLTQIIQKVVGEFYYDSKEKKESIDFEFDTEFLQGMYSFNILSLEDGAKFYGGYYYGDIDDEIQRVSIAICMCTYKREKYVYKNMKLLEKDNLQKMDIEFADNVEVFISDNAQTIDQTKFEEKVHVYKNKNVGGAGGFTRALIEAKKKSEKNLYTHALMMDDDVIISPEAIYRTYRLLTLIKKEYQDTFIGGAMLRMDNQWKQEESGASWLNGCLVSHKAGLDLRLLDACLYNEFEEKCDYNAWWYCTVPMKIVREDNLPLPIFIRGDDVEYGLRNMKNLILMNGICVWHEPFEFKYCSFTFYYIFRNRLINNAIRGICYTEKQFLSDFKENFFREVFTLRYKNAMLLLDGVNDFLNGIDYLKGQDGEKLNQDIMRRGYKLQYVEELSIPFDYPAYEQTLQFWESKQDQIKRKISLNGLFQKPYKTVIVPTIAPHIAHLYRAERALNYDDASHKGFETYFDRNEEIKLMKKYRVLKKRVKEEYAKRVNEYRERATELTALEFWKEYLEIE